MQRRYETVDVFSAQPFGGNPLAVVLDAEGLDTAAMQAIAREFNYSETTFVLPPDNPAHTARVRIFTPLAELPFAGHPNVGTGYVLAQSMPGEMLVFEETAGLVPVRVLHEAGRAVGAELTAPRPLTVGPEMSPQAAAAALSLSPADILTDTHPPIVAGMGVDFTIVELASRDALRRAALDPAGYARHFPFAGTSSIWFYTRDGAGADLHARMLWPGMPEDPATGSATVAAAALLARGGPDGEVVLQVEQGRDMGRPSALRARTVTVGGELRSAHVGGHCAPMMRGTLTA